MSMNFKIMEVFSAAVSITFIKSRKNHLEVRLAQEGFLINLFSLSTSILEQLYSSIISSFLCSLFDTKLSTNCVDSTQAVLFF